jgi:eukaryotic translation initiation factor 2C
MQMIDKVFDMVVERIKDWIIERYAETRNVSVPKNIIYYRDGVSEAQYHMIKDEELPHIRSAWPIALEQLRKDMKYPHFRNIEGDAPKLTAIVCAKRHHVRFYPKSAAPKDMAKNKNCPSGTYVDDVVTSPYYADFYLQSHAPIQGTARPAHYFILVNEMNRTVDELRQLVCKTNTPSYPNYLFSC